MASDNKKKQIAKQFSDLSEKMTELVAEVNQAITENQTFAINWGEANDHTAIVDGDGNIAGFNFTPAELSNAIGSYAALQTWATTHIGNVTKLSEQN